MLRNRPKLRDFLLTDIYSSTNRISLTAKRQADVVVNLARWLEREVRRGSPLDVQLAQHFRTHSEYGGRDRRFYSETLFSYFRWRGWLINQARLGPDAACALAYLMDAKEMPPVVKELAERGGLAGKSLRPLGTETPTQKSVAIAEWLNSESAFSFEAIVPSWLITELSLLKGENRSSALRRCLESFQSRPPTWLRVRSIGLKKFHQALSSLDLTLTPHKTLGLAFALNGPRDLAPLRARAGAFFEVQDLASQVVGIVCGPLKGQRWWDACAGAGGKALHLADLTEDGAAIVASDIRHSALLRLRRRAQRCHLRSITTRVLDACVLDACVLDARVLDACVLDACAAVPATEAFDGVLVDAPCSGIGTWSRNPDARWRIDQAEIHDKARLQDKILLRAASAVRPGGTLVYAVCTLSQAETSDVTAGFLEKQPSFQLEPTPHPISGTATNGEIWCWPWEGPADGMYVAKMRRFY
jgi:16S rRNA (cytosine967-C5)-methyltransferase